LRTPSLTIARIGAFSALIAVGNNPIERSVWISSSAATFRDYAAPVFYLAIATLFSRRVSFWATLIGSAVGETMNIFLFGEAPGALP